MRYLLFLLVALSCVTTTTSAEVVLQPVGYQATDASGAITQLRGWLAYDSSNTNPRPGVLIAHEWWGLTDYAKHRAEDYAKLGYVAFALDMYGAGVTANTVEEASKLSKPFYDDRELFRSRARAGLDQLLSNPLVIRSKVAALGYCFGGTTVLELARAGAPLNGVIVFHGGLAAGTTGTSGDASKIKGSVLVLNGAEDPMVKPAEREAFMNEMRTAKVDWEFVEFGGAVHAFSNPGVDKFQIPGAQYHPLSDRRSFKMSENFLSEIFSR